MADTNAPSYVKDIIASLKLSGAPINVGVTDNSVFIETEDNSEPIYISDREATILAETLLLAAYKARTEYTPC